MMIVGSNCSIPTISGSIDDYANSEITNSANGDEYATDFTDLGSDIDESEYRRMLLNDVS